MGATSLGINEGTTTAAEDALNLREHAAERLAEEMGRAARAYEQMTGRLGLVLDSGKTRRRAAWNCGGRSRADHAASRPGSRPYT